MRKAQFSPITVFFVVVAFIIGWAMFLGKFIGDWGSYAVESNNLSGFEALVLNNMNLVILIVLIIFVVGAAYFFRSE